MSEKLTEQQEQYLVKSEELRTPKHEETQKPSTENKNYDIHEIRKNIKELSLPKEHHKHTTEKQQQKEKPRLHQHYLTKKVKLERYKITLNHVQKNLPKSQRVFSKFIHQAAVESISEIGSKTIARPSGIIGGGAIALIISPIILFVAHKIGFEVPNSLIIILFIAGFMVGCLAEFILSFIRKLSIRRR